MARELQTLVDVHKHQFSLIDPERESFELWTNGWDVVQVGVSPQTLTVFTSRADGRVPLTVRIVAEEPAIDDTRWSGVVEGAHVCCPSGWLAVDALLGDPTTAPRIALEPVPHRGLVCFGDIDSGGYDMGDGADHYLVVLWPGEPETPRARKKHRPVSRARLEPRLPLGDALALSESPDAHDRFRAVAELARHGTADALARLGATEGEVARHHAACALRLARPLPMNVLAGFANDGSPWVRGAALATLQNVLFDIELGDEGSLDVDRAYDLIGPRLDDLHDFPRTVAESALRTLDSVADDLREHGATASDPGAPGPSASGLEQAALAYLRRLTDRGLLETTAGFMAERAAEAVIAAMDAMAHTRSGLGAALADALIEVPGVDDVFATDEELEAVLRE